MKKVAFNNKNIRLTLQIKLTVTLIVMIFVLGTIKTTLLGFLQSSFTHHSVLLTVLGGLISIVLDSLGAYVIIRFFLKKPIEKLSKQGEYLSKNDFTQRIDTKNRDELGQLAQVFNYASEVLRGVITEVQSSSREMASSSEQLSSISQENGKAIDHVTTVIQQVSERVERQSQLVKEMTNTMFQMSDGMIQISEKAKEMAASADQASQTTIQGIQRMELVEAKVKSIDKSQHNISRTNVNLVQLSTEIGSIVKDIQGISEQTNLLALNASIEASRAGEQGRSFAIVANEVRKLAEKAGQSASAIGSLIGRVQGAISESTQMISISTKDVADGVQVVSESRVSFTEIQHSIDLVKSESEDVVVAIMQISQGSAQITSAMSEISTTTTETSEEMESIAASSEEQLASIEEMVASVELLAQQARTLDALTNQFKVG